MTIPRPPASATCQACALCKLARYLYCEFCAGDFGQVDFDPATMALATREDVERMYAALWGEPICNLQEKTK